MPARSLLKSCNRLVLYPNSSKKLTSNFTLKAPNRVLLRANEKSYKQSAERNRTPASEVIESRKSFIQAKELFEHIDSTKFEKRKTVNTVKRFCRKLPDPINLQLFIKNGVTSFEEEQLPNKCPVFDSVNEFEGIILNSTTPLNQYNEWLKWTLEGKIWKFPVDNEQDWDEKMVPFYDHVFLEKQLDKKILQCEPIAMFLELVCLGLTKNPYYTVEQKREHLLWYIGYLMDKLSRIKASMQEDRCKSEIASSNN